MASRGIKSTRTMFPSADTGDLKQRIGGLAEGLTRSHINESAERGRGLAAAIGTETSATILPDIRDVGTKCLARLERVEALLEESERNSAVRHRELCTILVGLLNAGGPSSPNTGSVPSTVSAPAGKEKFFYGATSLSSGAHVIGCVLMHLDVLLAEHPSFQRIQHTDSTLWT